MSMLRSSALLVVSLAAVLLSGCATQTPYDYTAYKQSRPRSILILPPVNDSPSVEASYTVLSTMSMPLGESGYYVIPVALAAETFRQNGLSNPADIESVSIAKLRQIFGADAALYTHVKAYGTSYKLVTSESVVTVEGRLVDLRNGMEIWKGAASASSAEQRNNSSSAGLIGLLVMAVVNQVMESTTDMSHKMASVASVRLLMAGRPGGVLYGPRSPNYEGTEPAPVADPTPVANPAATPNGATAASASTGQSSK
ncbi:MAG: hypothetical protein E6R07_03265 [Nevskiaceae bacterium]|nr:MAG: hypothetical protein E6R07_03265 [Nevskiaceae bacterium]